MAIILTKLKVWLRLIYVGLLEMYFIKFDVWKQKKLLANYSDDIKDITEYKRIEDNSPVCIFVYYEPQGIMSGSVERALKSMHKNGMQVVIVSNHALSETQSDVASQYCYIHILRGNTGFDFGGYKDAFSYLLKTKIKASRLILLNDSVFFIQKGLDELMSTLAKSDDDVVAPYENWGDQKPHHIQSFALSVAKRVACSDEFISFWRRYTPINNRVYAIKNGEMALSEVLINQSSSTNVLNSAGDLYRVMVDNELDYSMKTHVIFEPWKSILDQQLIAGESICASSLSKKICDGITTTSPIHSGAYFFPKYMNSPMLKKDLVYRGRYSFTNIDLWSKEIMTPSEHKEFLSVLRSKGSPFKLSFTNKLLFNIGVK